MIPRAEININESVFDMLILMSEGNPGASTVLSQLMNKYDAGALRVFDLDDMNIRGPQIWVAYKNYCNCDIDMFCECIKKRDSSIVDAVNAVMKLDPSFEWLAVTHGASQPGVRSTLRLHHAR